MGRLRYLTAGESHGPALVGVLEGLPARLPLSAADLDRDLARRQAGHGRSPRQRLEDDRARILAGVRHGLTLGSPLAVVIENRDHANWVEEMAVEAGPVPQRPVTVPRPGHADLAGGLKYGWRDDLRPVLERASARETAMRVALGAAARRLLREIGVEIGSHVVAIGEVAAPDTPAPCTAGEVAALRERADASAVRCPDAAASQRMAAAIDAAREERDSVGGVVEVVAAGLPVGLGSHVQWDRKLDGRLGQALLSLPAVKGVEVGRGFRDAGRRGSAVHDPIEHDGTRFTRPSNNAGGLEGGISNGEPIVVRLAKKPISTLMRPLPSVDVRTLGPEAAHVERADACAVPALSVIAEAVVALVLADAVLEVVGGDDMESVRARIGGGS
jgi:chorismate synthase